MHVRGKRWHRWLVVCSGTAGCLLPEVYGSPDGQTPSSMQQPATPSMEPAQPADNGEVAQSNSPAAEATTDPAKSQAVAVGGAPGSSMLAAAAAGGTSGVATPSAAGSASSARMRAASGGAAAPRVQGPDAISCMPNTATCKDNVLYKCNADGVSNTEMICGAKVCSAKHASCDLCAEATECDGDTLVRCDATGQGFTRTRCPAPTPRCWQSRCVPCNVDSDCPPSARECRTSYCMEHTCYDDRWARDGDACMIPETGAVGYCDSRDECVAR
jgi:hypothetical protein